MSNRDRILSESVCLFNRAGVSAISTNHIAQALKISPGNLYFHFSDKEHILRTLFSQMTSEVSALMEPLARGKRIASPPEFLEELLEIFLKFRFFHREMCLLRRNDPLLAKQWNAHICESFARMRRIYLRWVSAGYFKKVTNAKEMEMILAVLLSTSSTYMQTFESRERNVSRESVRRALDVTLRFLNVFSEKKMVALNGERAIPPMRMSRMDN